MATRIGTDGDDTLRGTSHPDRLDGLSGDDILLGFGGPDRLLGRRGADRLVGFAQNDLLVGGFGDDTLDGGTGIDRATWVREDYRGFDPVAAPLTVDLTTHWATRGDERDWLRGIEDLEGSPFDDTLIGNGTANRLVGGPGDDRLRGEDGNDVLLGDADQGLGASRPGDDTLDGGSGFDLAVFAFEDRGAVTVDLAAGTAIRGDERDTLVRVEDAQGTRHADTLLGDAAANRLLGEAGADRLQGRAGDDTLIGGTGNDTLEGGPGHDLVSYGLKGNAGVRVDLEAGTAARDSERDTLRGIETVLGTTHADTLLGDAATNRLTGGADRDVLDGREGADYLDGGPGSDTLRGGAGNDHLFDLEGVDTLDGGPGNDELYGGSGSVSRGGAGDDRIGGSRLRDGGAGNDILNIGASSVGLTGGSGADVFMANALGRVSGRLADFDPGDGDVIDLSVWDASEAQAGHQRWSYIGTAPFSAAGQVRHEVRDDTTVVQASWDGVTGPGPALELELAGRLSLSERSFGLGFASGDGAEVITGTALAEHIDGGDGDDTLLGRGGADQLYGGDGRNLIRAGAGDDWIVGGWENDRIYGDAGDDAVQGGNGEDRIEGGAGDDDLYGGDGADTLAGDAGEDVFTFLGGDNVGFGQRDVIVDFGPGDLINLGGSLETARWFRNAPTHEFIGTAALTGPNQVRYEIAGERTIVQVSVPYDATLSQEIELAGRHTLAEADFIL